MHAHSWEFNQSRGKPEHGFSKIVIDGLIYTVDDVCPLFNYADDNTLAFFHSDMEILRTNLEEGSNIALIGLTKVTYKQTFPSFSLSLSDRKALFQT